MMANNLESMPEMRHMARWLAVTSLVWGGLWSNSAETAVTPDPFESVFIIDTGSLIFPTPGDVVLTTVDRVGLNFDASLVVDGGSRLFAGALLDNLNSSSGPFSTTLTVTGAGSRIELRGPDSPRGGMFTNGVWSVLDGGVFDAGDPTSCDAALDCGMTIGGTRDATSTLLVSGNGSRFVTIDSLVIGQNAEILFFNGPGNVTATVSAQSGGRIESERVILGAGVLNDPNGAFTATGTGLVNGVGSVWNAQDLVIGAGDRGAGILNVTAGGAFGVTNRLDMAIGPQSTGVMTVDGTGSRVTAGTMNVSVVGSADVTVSSGGVLEVAARLNIGQSPNEEAGTVMVDGTGSQLLVRDDLIVGDSSSGGFGQLDVRNGGNLTLGGANEANFIGTFMAVGLRGGNGQFNLDAATAIIEAQGTSVVSRLHVGDAGNGDVNLTNGATLTLRNTRQSQLGDGLIIGRSDANNGGFGTLVVDNSSLIVDAVFATVDIGEANTDFSGPGDGDGSLQVINGGLIRIQGSQATRVRLARGAGSTGEIIVDNGRLDVLGADVRVFIAHDLFGATGNGTGSLQVLNGGLVNITGTSAATTQVVIGSGSGDGALAVDAGGTVDINGTLLISLPSPSNDTQTGTVTVATGGVLETVSTIVGVRGSLTGAGTFRAELLRIRDGGIVDIGLDAVDEVVLEGGRLVRSDFSFGRPAGQRLSVINGGVIDLGAATFGSLPGTQTAIVVSDAGSSLVVAGDLLLGSTGNIASTLRLAAGAQGTVGGAMRIAGGSTLTVADAASRLASTGPLDIDGGSLILEGQSSVQTGALNVINGGLIGGTGTLTAGGVTIGLGGTLAPGNSAGLFNVNGDVTLAGGRMLFEIGGAAAGQFDVLNVNGDVDLQSGSFELQFIDGFTAASGGSFDLISATGTTTVGPDVNFFFNGLGPDFEFAFRNDGTLNIGTLSFVALDIQEIEGLTPNETAMAIYMDAICPRIEGLTDPTADEADLDVLCGNLRNGNNSTTQVAAGLDALMPDEILGIIDTLLRFTTVQHGNLSQRLNGLRNGAARVNVSGLDLVSDNVHIAGQDLQRVMEGLTGGSAGADEDFARWGFFSDGNFHFGDQSPGQHETGFDFQTVNISFGADYRLRDNLFLGGAIGYNEVNADFDTGGGMLMKATTLSLMGTYFRGESFYLDLLATYGWAEADTSRLIQYNVVGGAVDRRATGSTDGTELVASLGSGYDFTRGKLVFGPHGGLNHTDIRLDAFAEKGARGANISLPPQSSRSFTANAGAHASYTLTPEWGVLIPHARIDYVHEFQGDGHTEGVRFASDRFRFDANQPVNPAALDTDPAEKNYWTWSVGAHAQFVHGIAAFVNYRGHLGLGNLDVAEVTVGLRFERQF